MTENMKKFMELVSGNKELWPKVSAVQKELLIVIATENGIELTNADFEMPIGEISDDELETVNGGGEYYCALGGSGKKTDVHDSAKQYWGGLDVFTCGSWLGLLR